MIRLTDPGRIGAALRDLRAILGLTQVAMAETIGTTQGRYSEFETGAVVPSIPTLVRMFGHLGYDLALIPREDA
jgi:transcriptional regulator with XRE-family HTH domain